MATALRQFAGIFPRALLCAIRPAAMLLSIAISFAAHSGPVVGQGTWQTTLLGRDIDGNAVASSDPSAVFFYDTALNITWYRDAHYNRGTNYLDGEVGWSVAMSLASQLTIGRYSGWRLPDVTYPGVTHPGDQGCQRNYFSYAGGHDCGFNVLIGNGSTIFSEMAYLWYVELGNRGYCDPLLSTDQNCVGRNIAPVNTGYFYDVRFDTNYWIGLNDVPVFSTNSLFGAPFLSGYLGWVFNLGSGGQGVQGWNGPNFFMVVRPGDVLLSPSNEVPEPDTTKLMLIAMIFLLAVRLRPRRGPATTY